MKRSTFIAISGPTFSAEAKALLAAMAVSTSSLLARRIDRAIDAYKGNGLWTKRDYINCYAVPTSDQALLNWKTAATTASLVNTPTFIANSGFQGDGVGAYIDTGHNSTVGTNTFLGSSNSMQVWELTNTATAAFTCGTDNHALAGRSTAGDGFFSRNGATTNSSEVPSTLAAGMYGMSRLDGSTYKRYQFGQPLATVSQSTTTLANQTHQVLRRGTGTNYSPNRIGVFVCGGGLTDAEMLIERNIWYDFLTSVGAV